MSENKFPEWPSYSKEEIGKVGEVLSSGQVNYWTGSITRKFEEEFSKWCGSKYAIAVSNGTVALDLCMIGLNIGSHHGGSTHDEVIVTPRSFIASASVVVNAGAVPKFVDVCPNSQNIDPLKIKEAITGRTRAIICVHLAGWPCDIDFIKDIVGGDDIKIIEDCAQAHGALYKGRPVGSLGDIAAWSFCQDKIMSTGGEGGMVTCDDRIVWEKIWSYKDHGKSYTKLRSADRERGFRWLHTRFGSNFRLTEMQSAIGQLQLQNMPSWVQSRNRNAQTLIDAFMPFSGNRGPIRIPLPKCVGCVGDCPKLGCRHAYYRFYIFVRVENLKSSWTRDRIIEEIADQSVPCMQGSCSEIYLEQAFQSAQLQPNQPLQSAHDLGETSIAFLVHPTLDVIHMNTIASTAISIFKRASKYS